MAVFICNDHHGHWAVGSASVVVADNEDEARSLLDAALVADGLKPSALYPYTLRLLDQSRPAAVILVNGEY